MTRYRVYPRLRLREFDDGFIIGCPRSNIFVNATTLALIREVDGIPTGELQSRYGSDSGIDILEFVDHLHYLGFLVKEDDDANEGIAAGE
jgi:hypothetical protein